MADILHFADRFFLKFGIAYGEDFVDYQDFGFEMGGYGEA
jgi:hypothetical protein